MLCFIIVAVFTLLHLSRASGTSVSRDRLASEKCQSTCMDHCFSRMGFIVYLPMLVPPHFTCQFMIYFDIAQRPRHVADFKGSGSLLQPTTLTLKKYNGMLKLIPFINFPEKIITGK